MSEVPKFAELFSYSHQVCDVVTRQLLFVFQVRRLVYEREFLSSRLEGIVMLLLSL